jgi:hypothetical protein
LKRAIFDLGPSGFPFEHFIGELFAHQGYDVEVGVILDGACVGHEVDVLATKSTIQVPLYIDSRFRDIRNASPDRAATIDALQYGACAGLHLADWDSPREGSLKMRIDGSGLHPSPRRTQNPKDPRRMRRHYLER